VRTELIVTICAEEFVTANLKGALSSPVLA